MLSDPALRELVDGRYTVAERDLVVELARELLALRAEVETQKTRADDEAHERDLVICEKDALEAEVARLTAMIPTDPKHDDCVVILSLEPLAGLDVLFAQRLLRRPEAP